MSDFGWLMLMFMVAIVVSYAPDVIRAWRGERDE